MAVRRCTGRAATRDVDVDDVQCILEEGHPGEHRDTVDECEYEIDVEGIPFHCIRTAGHAGPHATGFSFDDPETCGETERGTGRVCLRHPHDQWPDAHDFGPGDNDMRVVPAWWVEEGRDPGLWPGGPVGTIPDRPRPFYSGVRPADSLEGDVNRHDVDEIKARRHKGGGVGYSEKGSEAMASVAEVRAVIERAKEHLADSIRTGDSNTNEIIIRAIWNYQEQRDKLEQARDALAASCNDQSGDLRAVETTAYASGDAAQYAATAIGHVMEGGAPLLAASYASASSAAGAHEEAIGGIVVTAGHVSETCGMISAALERTEQAIETLHRIKDSVEQGVQYAHASTEQLNTYLATL